jgi:hypothetical protein
MEILDTLGNIIPGIHGAGVVADGFETEDHNREIMVLLGKEKCDE